MNWPPLPRPADDAADLTPPEPEPRRVPESGSLADVLTFRVMLTPLLIQFVFWAGTFCCLAAGGGLVISAITADRKTEKVEKTETRSRTTDDDRWFEHLGRNETPKREERSSSSTVAVGVATMLLGPLVLRIWCELTIILFSIHRELKIANDRR